MDRKLLLLINQQWTSPALDRFMAALSSFDLWVPFLVLGLVIMAIRGSFTARAFVLVAALAAGISDGLVCNPLKHLVARPRPHQELSGIRQVDLARAKPRLLALGKKVVVRLSKAEPDATGRSFPSAHVVNTMTVATVAALFFPSWGWWGLAVPLLVAYSRIYTGAHWPSDVTISLILGLGIGLLATAGAELLWRRLVERFSPEMRRARPHLLPL
jgi:undecaprenyl-diphosphatase